MATSAKIMVEVVLDEESLEAATELVKERMRSTIDYVLEQARLVDTMYAQPVPAEPSPLEGDDGEATQAEPYVNPMEPMTREQLLGIIDDIRERVAAGDSWEGYLNYLMPDPDEDNLDEVDFRVEARYRIGNSEGQGGMRMIGVRIG